MNTQISSLIKDQLPDFIVTEYDNFAKILEGYYHQIESTGQPVDLISNLSTYRDIDFYEKHLLKERTTLEVSINTTDETITVADAQSFPDRNGYIKIGDEILFYKERTDTQFKEVSRGISGSTKLGDLYTETSFISSESLSHTKGVNVDNLSHLFLYALVKSFESEYLESFPEKYLKEDVDKRTLIKNIGTFYKVKGNDKSIRFIFNTIISKSADDIPTTYNPKDHTVKISTSDWDSSYGIQAVVLSGDANWLIGEKIVQQGDRNLPGVSYASAIVENAYQIGTVNGSPLWNFILNPFTINGDFVIPQQTVLTKPISQSMANGDLITVDSTFGWKDQEGMVVVNGEQIKYSAKSARQFTIKNRGVIYQIHSKGDKVYNYSTAKGVTSNGVVSLLVYGILTSLDTDSSTNLSQPGDKIQISKPGFETRDPILYDEFSQNYRWKVNINAVGPSVPLNPVIAASLSDYIADVSSIYEDEQYYYIATSSYPSTHILPSTVSATLVDPNLLKLIPKKTTTTTEVFSTPRDEIGVFVDGTIAYSYKDKNLIEYGPITKFNIKNRGAGYQKPPYVLIDGNPNKATAVLTGNSVSNIVTIDKTNYTTAPSVEIVSGRKADLRPIITSGAVTSILILNGGEYYSSPPAIIIGDKVGKGKFAEYIAVLSDGKIVDTIKIDGGKYYTQENVTINLVPDAYSNSATATAEIYEWTKDRYVTNKQNFDNNGGVVVTNNDNESHYGVVVNPKLLRYRLGDSLTSSTLEETTVVAHSPILGYAYDGHPIYGPYGHLNPLDKNSDIVRMNSGYNLKADRSDGPVLDNAPYPMGTFIDDYQWVADVNTGKTRLDRNNGRFCVTPEYPAGVYAYFLTIDEDQEPVFPYICGYNFYSIPVASNYEYNIKQSSLPRNAKRLYISGTLKNGDGEIAIIDDVSSGSVSSVVVEDSQPSFTVGSRIYVDNDNTGGKGAAGVVSLTYGKSVKSLESRAPAANLLTSLTPLYSFAGDIITQPSTGATGELLRDIIEETSFVVRNVQGKFEPELDLTVGTSSKTINSSSVVMNLLLSQDSSYTKDATLSLVKKADTSDVIASGKVLSATNDQNAVRVLVQVGDFNDFINYQDGDTILKSSDVANTAGTEIEIVKQLSEDIVIISVQDNIAIVETDGDHNMAEGDVANIEVDPDESITESTYWVRKKKFQEFDLVPQGFNGKLNDTGIGHSSLVAYGRDYVAGTYNDVELIFSDHNKDRENIGAVGASGNAKGKIIVPSTNFDGSGSISSIEIIDGGKGYSVDDIVTVNPTDVPKIDPSASNVTISPPPTAHYQNEDIAESFAIYKFTLGSPDPTWHPTIQDAWTDFTTNVLPSQVGVSFWTYQDHEFLVADGSAISVNDHLIIDSEIVNVVSVTGDTIKASRTHFGTFSTEHIVNSGVSLLEPGSTPSDISSDIGYFDDVITVTTTTYAFGDYIKINNEILKVVSLSGNDLTVVRGQVGTYPQLHYTGDMVQLYTYTENVTTLTTVAPIATNVRLWYVSKNDNIFEVTYSISSDAPALTDQMWFTGDNNSEINIGAVFKEYPDTAPKPQYRLIIDGVENPSYTMRVGSVFTMDAVDSHPIWIVHDYTTSLASDGVALVMDSYNAVSGVTNNGINQPEAAPQEQIVFTPQHPGTYYYVCATHPEMSGIITVEGDASNSIPLIGVHNIGLGVDRTDAILDTVYSLAEGDQLKVNDEILKIIAVDNTTRKVTFDRAQENTIKVNHPLNDNIVAYRPHYRFTFNQKIFGSDANDPRVISYDKETHKLLVAFDFIHEGATNPRVITEISSFFDHSNPSKTVSISKAYDILEKLQFSPDNTNFETNPVLQIQKYYFYKFDTSHPSMLGSYLDISTSPNYNIFTEEKEVGLIEPGNAGAQVRIRLGYGPNIGDVKRKTVNFISYYYFLTTEEIDTGGSYLSVREDPLAGDNTIIYTTDNKFVYNLDRVPQYDGTGDIRYRGRSVGKIASIALDNLGSDYISMPRIKGVVPAPEYKAEIECIRDILDLNVKELVLKSSGKGYSKPEAVVSNGDGTGLKIKVTNVNGSIVKAEIISKGSGYTYTPTIDVIETDNKIFFKSNEIGIPKSVKFIKYGSGYHNDNSIIPFFTSPYIFTLSNFDTDAFRIGEKVEQRVNGLVVASGTVAKNGWTFGSNILRMDNITGVFRENYSIINKNRGNKTAFIVSIEYSKFNPITTTREKQLGRFSSNRGYLNSVNQRITDSDFYQDYSYVIRSRTQIKDWRNAIKETTHPAGFKVFGEVYLESEASTLMDVAQDNTEKHTTYVVLPPVKVTSLSTKRTITQRYFTAINHQIERGQGSVAFDEFDETLTRTREITLSPAFDGVFDSSTGLQVGTTQFSIIDKKTGLAYQPFNEQELMITIDGVAQRPITSFRVIGNQIKFYEPPLGERTSEGQIVSPQTFYGRAFKFSEDINNVRYLKRLKNISDDFDGRQKNFDLYWEDGSIVKTDLDENLLIYLDSILQQGSYTIKRFVSNNKTDRLIFKKAPKNYADLHSDAPKSLQNEQYFYGQSVGNYQRMHIDENVIPYSRTNSYIIFDKENSVKGFDDPLYAYVYVNGVLQQDLDSYIISGPSIRFHKPLKFSKQSDGSYITDKVDILYFYGKNYQPTATCFDFESDVFYNRTTITFDGANTYDKFLTWFGPQASLSTYVYQILDGKKYLFGNVLRVVPSAGNTWVMDLQSQNVKFNVNGRVYFTKSRSLDGSNEIDISFDDINIQYNTNTQGERLLNRSEINILSWAETGDNLDSYQHTGELFKEHPTLKKNDRIKIDGEFAYRDVKSVPFFAKSKEYNDGHQVSNSFFSKIAVSEYNGEKLGEGFSITASLTNDTISKLDWNRRDLELYFDNNLLLSPTAYNYYTPPIINFIPVDGNGGGAKAQVLVYGGQIIDIILVDGGSGYTNSPKIVVSRGYDIIRIDDTFESSATIKLHNAGYQGSWAGMNPSTVCTINLWRRELMESFAVFILPPVTGQITIVGQTLIAFDPGLNALERSITQIVTPADESVAMSNDSTTYIENDIECKINASYLTYEHPVTKHTYCGMLDMLQEPVENPSLYNQGKLGSTVASFMEYLYTDVGTLGTGISLEQFEIFYPFILINQNPGNWMENYEVDYSSITTTGVLFNPGIPSISNRAGYLSSVFNPGDTWMYITGSTSHFPATGKLLVNGEIIRYSGTLNDDRFIISERGVDGTTEVSHDALDYFRELGKYN